MNRYWPNPAHKRTTTEAGPPRWSPNKDACPDDLTVQERNQLLTDSIPEDAGNPRSRRFALRRGPQGPEFYEAKWTESQGSDEVFHGHPTRRIPVRILRQWRDTGLVSRAEYERLRRTVTC